MRKGPSLLGRLSALASLPLLAVALSGCLGVSPSDDARLEPAGQGDLATLHLLVTDPAVVAIAGASVSLPQLGLAAETGADGATVLERVPPGNHELEVRAAGYHPFLATIQIPQGATVQFEARLEPIPTPEPRVDLYEFHGFYECTATYVIVTGDCFAAVRALPLPQPAKELLNATNAQATFAFVVPPGWQRIEIEQSWMDGALTLGSGMRVNVEPADAPLEGHAQRYARAIGESPLSIVIERGVAHESSDNGTLEVPLDGGELRTRTFHNGLMYMPGEPPYLGAGVAFQQEFTVIVRVTSVSD